MSFLSGSLWPYLIGVPVAIFGAGFLLGSLPFSFVTRVLLSIIIVIGVILYLQTRVSRTVGEIRDDPLSFFLRRRGEPTATRQPLPTDQGEF